MTGLLPAVLTAALAAGVAADGLFFALRPGLYPFVLLLLTGMAGAGVGRIVVGRLASSATDDEKSAAGAALGLGFLSLGTFALSIVGLLKPWPFAALIAVLLVAGWSELQVMIASLHSAYAAVRERPALSFLIAGPLLLALWACLVPPHQYDSLVYHLALPQEYLRVGRLHAPAGMIYAHFPQNGEMLFTLALGLGSDVLAQMYVWLASALTIGLLLTFGKRLTSAAPWAAVLVATHTAVLLMSSTTYVEPLVMLWTTASLLAFESSDEGRERGPLVLSALFAGLALGTKYYAGILCALLALRLVWRDRLKAAVLFSAVVTALFVPWMIKDYIFVGNPVFPFLYKVFPATSIGWTSDLATGYFQVLTEYGHGHGLLKDIASLPVLLFRNPLRFGGGMDVLGDVGWDLTLWLWPFGLWAAWKGRAPKGLALVTGLYFAAWFFTGVVLRFLTALAPALALLGAAAVAEWRAPASGAARGLAAAAAGAMIAAHLFVFVYVHGVFGSQQALLALEDREEFLSKRLDYYPCAAYARDQLGAAADLLVVGEQRGYYLPRAHRASTVHAPNLFVTRADAAESPDALARALRADGFTHLLFVPRETRRLGGSLGTFSDRGWANWSGLDKDLKTVFKGPACVVAALEAS